MTDFGRISDLFQTVEFQEAATTCETMEDWHVLLTKNGIDISLEDTIALISLIAETKQKQDAGELNAEQLDDVAGGIAGAAAASLVLSGGPAVWACIGIGVACVGVACVSGYVAYQALRWSNKHKCK